MFSKIVNLFQPKEKPACIWISAGQQHGRVDNHGHRQPGKAEAACQLHAAGKRMAGCTGQGGARIDDHVRLPEGGDKLTWQAISVHQATTL